MSNIERLSVAQILKQLEEIENRVYPQPKFVLFEHDGKYFSWKDDLLYHLARLVKIGEESKIFDGQIKTLEDLNNNAKNRRIYGKENIIHARRIEYIGQFEGYEDVVGIAIDVNLPPTYYAVDPDGGYHALYWDFRKNSWMESISNRHFVSTTPRNKEISELCDKLKKMMGMIAPRMVRVRAKDKNGN